MTSKYIQLGLNLDKGNNSSKKGLVPNNNELANKLDPQDRSFHDWYRFVLSFPPHLVRNYINDFGLTEHDIILDPFCGTGTTLIESKLKGIRSIGIEANPFTQFAASVKVDWSIDPSLLYDGAREIADIAYKTLKQQGIEDGQIMATQPDEKQLRTLDPSKTDLLLGNSISPLPLHKTLVLLDCLRVYQDRNFYRHALLALANALVYKISNLHFGPEVGVRNLKIDIPVISNWLSEIDKIVLDLKNIRDKVYPHAEVYLADARVLPRVLQRSSVDAVITSPPYPNEKDYTRTTRLESVLLGFVESKADLRNVKKELIRSNTRGVYKDDNDDKWVSTNREIQRLADTIERRRIELSKNSGFERLYGKVTKLYFGGMTRHLIELREILRPGAQLAYVVGDQASYLRVMIRTGQILADIANEIGYEVVRIDLFRTRLATATREQLREEVVILRWPGKGD